MASNSMVFFLVFMVVIFVMYKAASGHANIVENWGWTMTAMTPIVQTTRDDVGVSGNNQAQLFYDQNQLVNTNLLSNQQKTLLAASLGAPVGSDNVGAVQSKNSVNSLINSYSVTQENFEKERSDRAGPPVYTVAGTYQSDISPRFNSLGLNSYVKYNLPPENEQASYPNDPLTISQNVPQNPTITPLQLANMIEKPQIKEDYQSCQSASQKEYNDMNQKLIDQGAEVVNKLPVQNMSQSTMGQDKPDVYYNTDRYIFALQKSRLYGLADPIRGDLPVIPCNPESNPYSNVWFRPSNNPSRDLNAGAINIIAGSGNTSQTYELMARDAGGAKSVINGMNVDAVGTPVNNVQALQQAQYQNLNLGSQYNLMANNYNNNDTVTTSAFP
jgi:hypothetical protein